MSDSFATAGTGDVCIGATEDGALVPTACSARAASYALVTTHGGDAATGMLSDAVPAVPSSA
ncbi:hypothetical protein E2562_013408 [Oryza meyeriana var. granulata]|uniref:Uncharacterized protein n=1 Tax=Oryza meyeriana var. granulata TaxID=110450 RepID=A0A6G1EAH8_9ORYZ|nr:hypothetical protein E2562_013408 [Oryza meyeriana var. granulata]